MRTTSSGQVWVGYFDEGIFAWDREGGRVPLGGDGLVRWSLDLRPVHYFADAADLGSIDDCYAMNLDGESVWTCYYSDFPIVHIADDVERGWTNEIEGVAALLADGSACALIGGYGPEHDQVAAGRLGERAFERTFTGRLTLDGGDVTPRHTQLAANGSELNVFVGLTWYKLDLADLPGHDR